MAFSKLAMALSAVIATVSAQSDVQEIGFGPGQSAELYATANKNALNKSSIETSGFMYYDSAYNGTWTWNAGLSIINVDTNETDYPVSAAANTTSNVINVAYSLDFPGNQLPSDNNSEWNLCAFILDVDWSDDDYKKAESNPNDCTALLGNTCIGQIQQNWLTPGSVGCPQVPPKQDLSSCGTLASKGFSSGAAQIGTMFESATNHTIVGLQSGSIYAYELSTKFDRSQAQTVYNDFASKLRMTVLTFAPGPNYTYQGTLPQDPRQRQVKTFCTILNKDAPRTSAANSLGINYALVYLVALPMWLLL